MLKKLNTPNTITLLRIFMIPLFLLMIIPFPGWITNEQEFGLLAVILGKYNQFILTYGSYVAAAIFIVASSTDAVDGYIARKTKQITNLGKFLDPIADKMLVTAALFALVQNGSISSWIAIIIVVREFIVTGLRLIAVSDGIVISASMWGKIKTVLQMIAITLALLKNYPIAFIAGLEQFPLYDIIMFFAVLVTIYSGYDYMKKNRDVLFGER